MVRPQEEGRHAVSKINRMVGMKMVIEDIKRGAEDSQIEES